jgi:poly-gamma-glutamate capsule biosynthesis protein CapA/YwtB (metallophosphatase superfamily)
VSRDAADAPPADAQTVFGLTVLGQALIQHDLRADHWPDFAAFAAMLGRADACFTDLETAIRSPMAGPPTREGVFLHAADPVVLDCLKNLSISLLATANNHIWDLGTGGIVGALAELDGRGFPHTGAGVDLTAAAAPDYRRSANGRVALVAAASGGLRDGAAATATHGGVNGNIGFVVPKMGRVRYDPQEQSCRILRSTRNANQRREP